MGLDPDHVDVARRAGLVIDGGDVAVDRAHRERAEMVVADLPQECSPPPGGGERLGGSLGRLDEDAHLGGDVVKHDLVVALLERPFDITGRADPHCRERAPVGSGRVGERERIARMCDRGRQADAPPADAERIVADGRRPKAEYRRYRDGIACAGGGTDQGAQVCVRSLGRRVGSGKTCDDHARRSERGATQTGDGVGEPMTARAQPVAPLPSAARLDRVVVKRSANVLVQIVEEVDFGVHWTSP